jgi:hypothetical protein
MVVGGENSKGGISLASLALAKELWSKAVRSSVYVSGCAVLGIGVALVLGIPACD